MDLQRRVTDLEKEVADLKRQFRSRPASLDLNNFFESMDKAREESIRYLDQWFDEFVQAFPSTNGDRKPKDQKKE